MLEWLSRHERYLVVDELTVRAWRDVLKSNIDVQWVKKYLVMYYAKPDQPPITAGRINEAWYRHQEMQAPRNTISPQSVPMPDWFKEKIGNTGRIIDDE